MLISCNIQVHYIYNQSLQIFSVRGLVKQWTQQQLTIISKLEKICYKKAKGIKLWLQTIYSIIQVILIT